MMGGQLARAAVQAVSFLCVARALGVAGYGAFVGVTALVAVLAPFVGWGAGALLVQQASRDPSVFRAWWGYAIEITLLSGAAFLLLAAAVAFALLPPSLPLALVLLVGAADLISQRLVDLAAQAFQAFHRLRRTAQLQLLPALFRLGAAGLLLAMGTGASPVRWGVLYLAATTLCAVAAVALVSAELGRPVLELRPRLRHPRNGFFFAVVLSSQSIYNDIDKTMLARLGELTAVGVYGAAYRLIDVSFVPVRALLFAAYARFFVHGTAGIGATTAFARRLVPPAVLYSSVAAAALYAGAPLLPLALGPEFAETVQAVRWLAPLPVLRALHYFPADALTGADRPGLRSGINAGAACVNVMLNLWLIPLYSWRGAAMASLASDAFLVLAMWAGVGYVRARERAGAGRAA